MKPYITIPIIIYYIICAIVLNTSIGSPITEDTGITNTIDINEIDVSEGSGFDILRFLGVLFFGIGLPADVPDFVSVGFAMWQILILIAFIISLIA